MPPKTKSISEIVAERLAGFDPFQATERREEKLSLEYLLTDKDGFGLRTASPLQRAVCRVMDGTPIGELGTDPDVIDAFGGVIPSLGKPPREMIVLSAIRSGKSLISAARAVQLTQTCDVSGLVVGEVPRVSVLSLKKDLAQVVFGYVCGLCQGPLFRDKIIGEPTADSILVRHPSGRPVEIKVTAGHRAGSSLVSRWSAGVVFDEAPRMVGAEDGVVNLDDARGAVLGRMLPGATILYPGSPWAPFGPVFNMHKKHFGAPTQDIVVVKAPGWAMNPVYWTDERCDALRTSDKAVFDTDVAAEFADKILSFLPFDSVEACVRKGLSSEPRQLGWEYVAAMDPATRGNAWTLGIAALSPTGVRRLVRARQWQGNASNPLSPEAVFEEMAHELRAYGVNHVSTDQWSFDALADVAIRKGIVLDSVTSSQQSKVDWFSSLRAWFIDKRISIIDVPELATDLKRVQRKVTQTGVTIELPRTSDGRHCDYAAMLALLMTRYMPEASNSPQPPRGPVLTETEQRIEDTLLAENERYQWDNDL